MERAESAWLCFDDGAGTAVILPDLNYDVFQYEIDVMIRKLIRENTKTSTNKMTER